MKAKNNGEWRLIRGLTMAAAFLVFTFEDVDVSAQGTITFWNFGGPGIDAPVFHTDCQTRLEGDQFLAALYAGREGSSEMKLVQIGAPLPFLTDLGAGYFDVRFVNNTRVIPFVQPGATVVAQVRVWEAQAGSFEAAKESGWLYGQSNPLTVMTQGSITGLPAYLIGLESFCLIPEPSTKLLLGAGGAFLLGWCLRKNRKGKLAESRA
jgi:hypothetical protein